jgi:hypothetical protein
MAHANDVDFSVYPRNVDLHVVDIAELKQRLSVVEAGGGAGGGGAGGGGAGGVTNSDLTSLTDRITDLEWELRSSEPYDLINAVIMSQTDYKLEFDATNLFDSYLSPYTAGYWMTDAEDFPEVQIDTLKPIRVGSVFFYTSMNFTTKQAERYPLTFNVYYKSILADPWTLAGSYTRPTIDPIAVAQDPNQGVEVAFDQPAYTAQYWQITVSGHVSPYSMLSQAVFTAPSWPRTLPG